MALDIESITTVLKEGMPALEVLAGSKVVALFLEKISGAIGWYVEPKQIVRKAHAEATANLIKAETDQEVKALEQRTAARVLHEETKYQQNIESIVIKALPGINDDAKPGEVDDDWLTNFFDKCRKVSNEEMQMLWSQILAGEVNNPGIFSPRTLQALSTFTKYDAETFKKYCSYIWHLDKLSPAILYPKGVAKTDFAGPGSGPDLYHLVDIGVFLYQESKPITYSGKGLVLSYNEKYFSVLQKDDNGGVSDIIKLFPFGYVKLTQIGGELSSITKPIPNFDFMNQMIEYWKSKGFVISELPSHMV